MARQIIKVTEITGEQLLDDGETNFVSLTRGDTDISVLINSQFNAIRAALTKKARRVFILTWKGDKVPSGAMILGHEVVWTQDGMVQTAEREIGTYQRLLEFGGDNHDEQVMLCHIFAQPKS